jgi:hypothetical protein
MAGVRQPLTHNTGSFPEWNWLDQDHIGGPDAGPTGYRKLSAARTTIDRMLLVPCTVDIWNCQPAKFGMFITYLCNIILSIHAYFGPQGDIIRAQVPNNYSKHRYFLLVVRVAQLVEALRYKPEGSGFDPKWCHCSYSVTQSFRPLYSPGVDLASNRNEYQEYFLGG